MKSVRRSGRSREWLKMKNPACAAVKREEGEDWNAEGHGSDYPVFLSYGLLMVTLHAICSVMARLIALVIVATALTACAPCRYVVRHMAYRQKMDDEVTR